MSRFNCSLPPFCSVQTHTDTHVDTDTRARMRSHLLPCWFNLKARLFYGGREYCREGQVVSPPPHTHTHTLSNQWGSNHRVIIRYMLSILCFSKSCHNVSQSFMFYSGYRNKTTQSKMYIYTVTVNNRGHRQTKLD